MHARLAALACCASWSTLAAARSEVPPQALPEGARPALLREFQAAEYPFLALARGIEADIPCELDLDDKGRVRVVACEGTDRVFVQNAEDALARARFVPARLAGNPAPAHVRFLYRYLLNRERELPVPRFEPGATVEGEVLEQGTRTAVKGADVIVQGLGVVATTDAAGRFTVQLPQGSHVLVVFAPDYFRQQVRFQVAPGAEGLGTIHLRRSAVSDYAVVVPGERTARIAPTKESISHEELRNVPGTQNDPLRVVEDLPGLARIPYSGGQLIVRGASAQDTGAYIDGQKIPVLYHLLNGPSVLGEEMVERIDFYPGGAGVFYGNNLAGIVAVQSRKGADDRFHGSLAADLQKTAAFLSGPLSRDAQLAVGARVSYVNPVVSELADPDQSLTVPVYWDYQGRSDVKLSPRDRLTLLAYGSNDSFAQVGGGRGAVPLAFNQHIGFHRARLQWDHRDGEKSGFSLAPQVGLDLSDDSSSGAGAGAFARPQSHSERAAAFGLRGGAFWALSEDLQLRVGIDAGLNRVKYDLDILYASQLRGLGAPNAEEARLSGVKVFADSGQSAELGWKRGELRVTPGFRFDVMHWTGHTWLTGDPRLWIRWDATPSFALFTYAGVYHQAPTAEQVDQTIGNPGLTPERSNQAGAGFELRLGDLWTIKAEGYLARRESLVFPAAATANADGTFSNPLQLNSGRAHAIGLEVLLRREFTERLYGWIAYTLSRSRELPGDGTPWRPTAFDQPQIVTLLVGYRPSPYVEFATRVRLASGNPIAEAQSATFDADSGNYLPTLLPLGTTRLPTFVQIDFELNNIWVDDVVRLQLYLDFQNMLGRRNAEALIYDFRYARSGTVAGVPFSGSLGAKVSF